MNIVITSEEVLYICGIIASLWGVFKIYKELHKPTEEMRNKVHNLESRIEKLESKQEETTDDFKALMQGVFALVNHAIDGNGIDKLKESRDYIQNQLIEK